MRMFFTVVREDAFFTWCVRIVLTVVWEDVLTVVCEDVRVIALVSSVSRIDATHRVVAPWWD